MGKVQKPSNSEVLWMFLAYMSEERDVFNLWLDEPDFMYASGSFFYKMYCECRWITVQEV
jgi:hypothetical protein